MPQPVQLDPSAFSADGGPIGVLLIHGYTGSVAETRPMGEYLAVRGLTVRCPLLLGHGTVPRDLTHIRWQDWAAQAQSALEVLQNRCQSVFVGGLSLGPLLALWLAARYPDLAGLILMAPAIQTRSRLWPLALGLRYLLKYSPTGPTGDPDLGDPEARSRIWCYDKLPLWGAGEVYLLQLQVRRALARVRQPVLLFQGRRDACLAPDSAQIIYDRVASADKTLVWLEHSGHNLLVDGERESVWAQSHAWMVDHAPHRRR